MNAEKNLINAIRALLIGFPSVEKAVLFGSRARRDNGERSDYDIALYGNPSRDDKIRLRFAFSEELPTLHKIDLIFMNEAHPAAFLSNIEKEGISFYEKTE